MTFRPSYLVVAIALFFVEVAIARGYIPGVFVRNSVGDVLVIVLLYCLLRGVLNANPTVALGISLAAGLTAEVLQYLHLADLLGLKPGSLPYIVLGNTFNWSDLLMYSIGGVLAAWLDVRDDPAWRAARARLAQLEIDYHTAWAIVLFTGPGAAGNRSVAERGPRHLLGPSGFFEHDQSLVA